MYIITRKKWSSSEKFYFMHQAHWCNDTDRAMKFSSEEEARILMGNNFSEFNRAGFKHKIEKFTDQVNENSKAVTDI